MKKKKTKVSAQTDVRVSTADEKNTSSQAAVSVKAARKNGKRNALLIVSALAAVLLIGAIVWIATGPHDARGLEYTVNADGVTCTITGVGSCKTKKVHIPEYMDGYRVTAIGNNVFYNYGIREDKNADENEDLGAEDRKKSKLTEVTIPESVTSIGAGVFYGCNQLKTVNLPSGLERLGAAVFYNCVSLKDVVLPQTLKSMDWGVFYRCESLESMVIPDAITEIGQGMFYGCTSLKTIQISEDVTKIGNNAFYGCSALEEFTVPEGVTEIADWTFAHCTSLESIDLPDGITYIGSRAFSSCVALKRVELPSNVKEISMYAFYGCEKLTEITLPDTLTTLGVYAFDDCFKLSSVTLSQSLTEICNRSFDDCRNLKTLTIPVSVTKLGSAILATSGIKEVYYEGTVQEWNAVEKTDTWFAVTDLKEVVCSDGTVALQTESGDSQN